MGLDFEAPETVLSGLRIRREGRDFDGGNQNWLPRPYLRGSGCGLIAAADLLLCLRQGDSTLFRDLPAGRDIPPEAYDAYLERLRRRFPPVIPRLGMNAWVLCLGLNLCFRSCRLPYRARWGVRPRRLWAETEAMLKRDVPVILCVGPNFPLFWRKNRLTFYTRAGDSLCSASWVKAHFVTVTGLSPRWVRIVSWGQTYYIRKSEFMAYAEKYSNFFLCNIMRIKAI